MNKSQYRQIENIRKRLRMRMDADEKWITINGTHVMVGENGELQGSVGKKISDQSKKQTASSHSHPSKRGSYPPKQGASEGARFNPGTKARKTETVSYTQAPKKESPQDKWNSMDPLSERTGVVNFTSPELEEAKWNRVRTIEGNGGGNADKSYKLKKGTSELTHPNGSKATDDDIVNAVEYMYGTGDKTKLRKDLENGEYSKSDIERCLDYHATKGLPSSEKQGYFKQLQAERAKKNSHQKTAASGSNVTPKKAAQFNKTGAPNAEDLGFSESAYKKAEKKYMDEHGKKHSYDLLSSDKQKIADEVTKSIPKHVVTDDSDYEIDHIDYVGGQFVNKGKVNGISIGDSVKTNDGTDGKIISAHVYPNGSVDYNVETTDRWGFKNRRQMTTNSFKQQEPKQYKGHAITKRKSGKYQIQDSDGINRIFKDMEHLKYFVDNEEVLKSQMEGLGSDLSNMKPGVGSNHGYRG